MRKQIFETSHINGYAFIIDVTHYRILKSPANVDASRFLIVKDGSQ